MSIEPSTSQNPARDFLRRHPLSRNVVQELENPGRVQTSRIGWHPGAAWSNPKATATPAASSAEHDTRRNDRLEEDLEATGGFEPPDEGFADPCLTTWPRRPGFGGDPSKDGYSKFERMERETGFEPATFSLEG